MISEDIDDYDLALEMIDKIGSTDPELRDGLIFRLFMKIIKNNQAIKNDILIYCVTNK